VSPPERETRVQVRTNAPDADLVAERIERLSTDPQITRRNYLKVLAVLSGGLAAGSVAVSAGAFRRRTQDAANELVITDRASAVPVGGEVRFAYPTHGDPAMLVRLGSDHWVAYSAVCTHLSCEVLWRPENRELFCPCHDGHFDVDTGTPTGGPPKRPLPAIRLERRGDAIVAIGEGAIRPA
jgi:Rieske Fe-S protein